MAEAAADPRGMKRICTSCGTRFYDMNNRPIVCPNCSAEFTGEVKPKSKRGKAKADTEGQVSKKTAANANTDEGDDEDLEDDDDDMVVSLDS